MKTYSQFHGEILISEIGKELRKIVKNEKVSFKVLTGYGSASGSSKSKIAVLKSLSRMKKEGLIKAYLPGEIKNQILLDNSPFYNDKVNYESLLRNDKDFGNDGIIFVFL